MTVIPIAMRSPNFEMRTHAWVTRVLKDPSGGPRDRRHLHEGG